MIYHKCMIHLKLQNVNMKKLKNIKYAQYTKSKYKISIFLRKIVLTLCKK